MNLLQVEKTKVLQRSGRFWWTDAVDQGQGVCVCARVCAWMCVCVYYKIFELFGGCHVDSADYTVCVCVSVSVSVSVPLSVLP